MNAVYADMPSTLKESDKSDPDLDWPGSFPVGNTVADAEQFQQLEALFNEFYKWHVPKKVQKKTIQAPGAKRDIMENYEARIKNVVPSKSNLKMLYKMMGG